MSDMIYASKHQSLAEIRQWDIDFSADLEAAVTVVSATATHLAPSGSPTTPVVGSIANNIVPVMFGPVTGYGKHILDVLATLSDGEKSEVRIEISIDY